MDISVVICTRNRCATLKKVLGSLEHQSSAGLTWEIVVVDNSSVDQTKEVVEEFRNKAGFPTRYVLEREPGLSNARNHGIRESEGSIVAFLDDDVTVAHDWLTELNTAIQQALSAAGITTTVTATASGDGFTLKAGTTGTKVSASDYVQITLPPSLASLTDFVHATSASAGQGSGSSGSR